MSRHGGAGSVWGWRATARAATVSSQCVTMPLPSCTPVHIVSDTVGRMSFELCMMMTMTLSLCDHLNVHWRDIVHGLTPVHVGLILLQLVLQRHNIIYNNIIILLY